MEVEATDETHLDGVAVFLILSVAEEVTAIVCGTLPVVIPQLWQGYTRYRKYRSTQRSQDSAATKIGAVPQSRSLNKGFQKLGENLGTGHLHENEDSSSEQVDSYSEIPLNNVIAQATLPGSSIPMNSTVAEGLPRHKDPVYDARIVVKKEVDVSRSGAAM